ncbi:gefF [Symbiodinium natans]|uniref:GefF protein n=1 Tax=Symbiodinium natans TaxID=878477 RepID=A0A812N231_9DINO|nr:gefF [Symbiodinium natans]
MHVAVVASGCIWIHAGSGPLRRKRQDLWRFRIADGNWTDVSSDGPGPRESHVAVTNNSHVWVHGGHGLLGLLDDLWFFRAESFETPAWSQEENRSAGPSAREMHDAVLMDAKIWVHGGRQAPGDRGEGRHWLSDVWYFDLLTKKWGEVERTPEPRIAYPTSMSGSGKLWLQGLRAREGDVTEVLVLWECKMPACTCEETWTAETEPESIHADFLFVAVWTLCSLCCSVIGAWLLASGELRLLKLGLRWLVSPIGICRCDTKFMLISVMCALMSTVVGFAISLLLFSKKLLNIYNDYQDFKHLRDSVHETSVFASYFAVPSGVVGLVVCFVVAQRVYNRKVVQPLSRNGLLDPRGLAKYLVDADIRLVRFEYLKELKEAEEGLPRRQEAQRRRTASGKKALVSHKEVLDWACEMHRRPLKQRVIAVSHGWEAQQHPDPWNFQLNFIVDSLEDAWSKGLVFAVFFDYVSVHQFRRTTPHQQKSFQRTMKSMHILYAHDWAHTLVIQEMTPDQLKVDKEVLAYFETGGLASVREQPIAELKLNSTPYLKRGWCLAELQWSSLKGSVLVELAQLQGQHLWNQRAPLPPDFFRKLLSKRDVKFTHRSDIEVLIKAQQHAFAAKASQSTSLHFANLTVLELDILADALHHYSNIAEIHIVESAIHIRQSKAESGPTIRLSLRDTAILDGPRAFPDSLTFDSFVKRLNFNSSLRKVSLPNCKIGDGETHFIALALRSNRWTYLDLQNNIIGPAGATEIAAHMDFSSLEELILAGNRIEDEGAICLLKAWALSWKRVFFHAWRTKIHEHLHRTTTVSVLGQTLGQTVEATAASLYAFVDAEAVVNYNNEKVPILKMDLSDNAISDRGRSMAFIRPSWAEVKLGRHHYEHHYAAIQAI